MFFELYEDAFEGFACSFKTGPRIGGGGGGGHAVVLQHKV